MDKKTLIFAQLNDAGSSVKNQNHQKLKKNTIECFSLMGSSSGIETKQKQKR